MASIVGPSNTTFGNGTTIGGYNPANDSNLATFLSIVVVAWSCAFITACLRFYTRAILVRSFGKDDVFMVLAVLFGIAGFAAWIVCCRNGYGRRQRYVSRDELSTVLEAQFYESVLEASFAFGFLKVSIALSLLRLNRGGRWYKRILWTLIGFTCFYTLFAFITFLTWCRPISGLWERTPGTKCYNRELYRDFGLFNAACNITTDVLFATLPVPLIWSLQLQRRTRLYLIGILSGGYFAVALGVAKAVFIIAFVHERDGTFQPWAPFFGALQLDIGIIAACTPTLRPLLGSLLKLSDHGNYKDANYYRAGKALDRIPKSGSEKRRYLRQNTASGVFVEGMASPNPEQWAAVNREKTSFTATVNNGESVKDEVMGEKPSIDEDAIMQIPPDPDFKGIVKTTEYKVEK
ncbi:hypothetical protein B0T14DRAFT_570888 [Immersiella caudata]|uniref:Rhodopsin domain-containing protein n=1 Tax=Immersiella caudata TaxID=314043 RepID=A0AA39TMY3_9PEZI|nr:hypothetical protein B0T14DRAFT_570888 [Immersiella caudata]